MEENVSLSEQNMQMTKTPWRIRLLHGITLALFFCCLLGGMPRFTWIDRMSDTFGGLMAVGVGIYLVSILYVGFCILTAYLFYRPCRDLFDCELPDCTVIVPAYNEGKGVLTALESVLASDYPADRLHIIAIDDGSVDDTWDYIQQAAERSNGRILALRQPKNGGKRRALYRGIRESRSGIIVTVDSDSKVMPDTLRKMVSPFRDSEVGAVAGNIRVLNPADGVLPRMMDVNFVFNFGVVRSAQSVLGVVLCTPGALSAYRRSALLPFLEKWLDQHFLGRPAGIGEDRALASGVLLQGYRIVFQRQAEAFTTMPATFRTFCKMLMRWSRGDFRETIQTIPEAFRHAGGFWTCLQLMLIFQTLWLALPILCLPILVAGLWLAPLSFVDCAVWTSVLWGTLPAAVYRANTGRRGASWGWTYAVFCFFFLFWIIPYCALTMGNSKWLTREKAQPVPPQIPAYAGIPEPEPIIAEGCSDEETLEKVC